MRCTVRTRALAGLALIAVALLVTQAWSQDERPEVAQPLQAYVSGELLVKFRGKAPPDAILNASRGVGARHLGTFPGLGVRHWRLGKGVTVERALQILSNPGHKQHIEFVEPNYIVHADAPDDTLRGHLCGLHNVGQAYGTPDADIDALEAWQAQTGSSDIVVAIIDSGIDYSHPDLAANIWTNPGEIADNGQDDDNNGYVDDVMGWDFVNDDNDPFDDRGHGTHVAGTIGALGNNGIGVAGVCWNVKLMPLKFLNASGTGTTADAVKAVQYATALGVPITNNSWGGGAESETLELAISNSGALFVASAGNDSTDVGQFPAYYDLDNIISVASTDKDDELASSSNYGVDWVDLGAPGVYVLSTLPDGRYWYKSGTSMAAPHVAGVAALVMASGTTDPLEVKAQILGSVDAIPALAELTVSGGRLNARRAVGAPELPADSNAPAPISDLELIEVTGVNITLAWTAPADDGSDPASGPAYHYEVRYYTEEVTEANWESTYRSWGIGPGPGTPGSTETYVKTPVAGNTDYYFGIKVADEAGNFSSLVTIGPVTTGDPPLPPWTIQTVDAGTSTMISALALDADGNPHISYGDQTNQDLKFARRIAATWVVETVPDPIAQVGRWASLALGADGAAHVTYLDDTNDDLRYANLNGETWTFETADSVRRSSCGNWSSLVVDANGDLHVSYRMGYDWSKGGLKYARRSGSEWSAEVVDGDRGAGVRGTSLALDSAGRPHIAYSCSGSIRSGKLKYAYWTGSKWKLETVDAPRKVVVGWYCSLALDAADNPHISYCDWDNSKLKYATKVSGSWVIQEVDSDVWECTLAVDSQGRPHISYFDPVRDDLKYAQWDGDQWNIEVVAENGEVGGFPHLVLDANDKAHISYHDSTRGDLKYARKN